MASLTLAGVTWEALTASLPAAFIIAAVSSVVILAILLISIGLDGKRVWGTGDVSEFNHFAFTLRAGYHF